MPPERLLRAQLLQVFYAIPSERPLMAQLDYKLLVWQHAVTWRPNRPLQLTSGATAPS